MDIHGCLNHVITLLNSYVIFEICWTNCVNLWQVIYGQKSSQNCMTFLNVYLITKIKRWFKIKIALKTTFGINVFGNCCWFCKCVLHFRDPFYISDTLSLFLPLFDWQFVSGCLKSYQSTPDIKGIMGICWFKRHFLFLMMPVSSEMIEKRINMIILFLFFGWRKPLAFLLVIYNLDNPYIHCCNI